MINSIIVSAVKHNINNLKNPKNMSKLDEIAMFLYNKKYADLEPHEQHEVYNTVNNPEY